MKYENNRRDLRGPGPQGVRAQRSRPTGTLLAAAFLVSITLGTPAAMAEPAPVAHARNLEIEPCDHATVVTVRNAWPDAPDLTYTLVPRGARRPDNIDSTTTISTPVRRVISLSTPNIPFLRDLGVLSSLVAVDTGDYVYDERTRERIASNEVRAVGSGASLDLERVIELQPDLVLVSALGPDDPAMRRLRGAGIPVLVVADWREQTPLGRAEWIRLFGVLYQRDRRATELFRERAHRYDEIRELVAARVPADRRPTVLANGPWQGSWPVPAGGSYVARLFADAGGDYLWAETEGTGSIFLDLEAVLARALAADYWINLNYDWTARADVRRADPRLTAFSAYRNNRMYHHIRRVHPSGANDYWESGVGRPDVVLADLVKILHGEDRSLLPDHEPVYYRRIDP
jgi:iron complex transport system substrate-binding protein